MFKSLFKKTKKPEIVEDNEKLTAITCLLVEAALIDGEFGEAEKDTIISIIKKQFNLKDDTYIDNLIDKAKADLQNSGDLVTYTRVVKENWKLSERVEVIELLWKVCLVDNIIEPYEDMLIRRIAGLIYVSDKDRNLAKKRIMSQ